MSFKVEMPHVGESVTEAVIGKWLKAEGDRIEKYDPIVEVVTDKVSMEVPAPVSGTLSRIVAIEGEIVQMGAVIAEMELTGGDVPVSGQGPAEPAGHLPEPGRIGELITGANVGPTGGAFIDTSLSSRSTGGPRQSGGQEQPTAAAVTRYSPVVVRLAVEHGIDLSTVAGTGLGGRVTRNDVHAVIASSAAGRPKSPAAPVLDQDRVVQPSPVRRMIADHMVRGWREIPHAWSAIEVDVTGLVECRAANRARFRERHGIDLTYLPLTLHAVSGALQAHDLLNSSWEDGRVRLHAKVNVGIAVAARDGLVVPVVPDADQKGVVELARELGGLVQRARDGQLKVEDVRGGTFTLNNTGALGSVWGGAIINHPQAAILTTEAIVKRPVVVGSEAGDSITVRSIMNICLSFDHRIIDGAEASAFLQDVRSRFEAFSSSTELS